MGRSATRQALHGDREAAPDAPRPGAAAPDWRSAAGNRTARTVLGQAKLTVGASDDPLEIEADRVAADVVRSIAASGTADAHTCGAGCGHDTGGSLRRHAAHSCGPGCGHPPLSDASGLVRRSAAPDVPIGAAGGEVQAADETALQRARSGGATRLPDHFRSKVEGAMGADFSQVRLHTGGGAEQLNRSFGADAFTVGNDIFFRDGMPNLSSREGAHLVTHELTHTIQQGSAPSVARRAGGATGAKVQRHSSFEHLMLGNVKPGDLAKVGAWQDAIKQTDKKGGGKRTAAVKVDVPGLPQPITKSEIMHVLLQEMLRLKQWQDRPPKKSSVERADRPGETLEKVGADPTFQVLTVRLPQGLICTYGEMNTLGDYFGSVDVLKRADEKNVWQLLQSVREETWNFLQETYSELAGSLTREERDDANLQRDHEQYINEIVLPNIDNGGKQVFAGATAARISGMAGQLELITGIQGTGVGKGDDKTNKYLASLGRNACHFVPESWHAWANNHDKARELATRSYDAATRAAALERKAGGPNAQVSALTQIQIESARQQSTDLANEALVTNGFGDHFLQDSYAAGHMINKTQIMQWYVEYIDKKKQWDYFKDKNWRKVQNIAYGQNLTPSAQYNQSQVKGYGPGSTGKGMDPQSVENRKNASWQENFEQLGLQVPRSLRDKDSDSRIVFGWLQQRAASTSRKVKGSDIDNGIRSLSVRRVSAAVADLVADGVVRTTGDVSERGEMMADMRDNRAAGGSAGNLMQPREFLKTTFLLREDYVPKKKKGQEYGPEPSPDQMEAQMQDQFKAITYGDYLEFIQSSFLQKSTNALHDTFCKGGLTVFDRTGAEIGKVYGDDSMFNEGSSAGLEHSGKTANKSRDAILNIINKGDDQGETQQSIIERFPFAVQADIYDDKGKVLKGGVKMDIADWHNSRSAGNLKKTAFDRIFPSMDWGPTQKLFPGASKTLGDFFTTAGPPHLPF